MRLLHVSATQLREAWLDDRRERARVSAHEHLLAPGRIGSLELRNRMVMAPMGEDLGDLDGMVSAAQMAYLEARARGGLAMVMLGSVAVSFPVGCSNARQTAISDDRHVAGWREAAQRVHRHGSTIAMQLTQTGANSLQDTMAGRPMWVASEPGPPGRDDLYGMVTADEGAKMMEPFVGPDSKLFYKVLDHDDIASVIDDFASAVGAGPRGGRRRLRAARRARLPDRRLPLAGEEPPHRRVRRPGRASRPHPGGDPAGDPSAGRRRLRGLVPAQLHREPTRRDDARRLHHDRPTRGRAPAPTRCTCPRTTTPASATGPTDSYTPQVPGLLIDNARAVKAALDVPVIAVGRITPDAADAAIADGAFDFVSMARMILAEPELPNLLAPRAARGDPALRVPLPLHRQHLRAGSGAMRGERLGRPRGRARRRDRVVTPFGARDRRRTGGNGSGAGRGVARPLGHAGRRRPAPRGALGVRGRHVRRQRRPAAVVRAPARAAGCRRAPRGACGRGGSARGRSRRRRRRHRRALVSSRAARCRPSSRAHGRRPRPLVARPAGRWGPTSSCSAATCRGSGLRSRRRGRAHGSRCSRRPTCSGSTSACPDAGAGCTTCGPRVSPSRVGPTWWRSRRTRCAGAISTAITRPGPRWSSARSTPTPTPRSADELRTLGVDVAVVGDASVGAGLLEHAMRSALETAVAL